MTTHEHLSGQIVWIALGVGVITLAMTAFISDAALSHQARMVDLSTYFLIDMVSLLTAVFTGSSVFSKDFSNRGIAELVIPSGMSRSSLILWRISAHGINIFVVTAILFLTRQLAFLIAQVTTATMLRDSLTMFLFCSLKTILALAVATCLGCFTRPVVALLGTMTLFLLGHFSSGISGARGIADEGAPVSPVTEFLLKVLRIWNPNNLVLESLKGTWETPKWPELVTRVGWGLAAIAVFAILAALIVRKRDVGAMRT
jgi:ABC-type multidrug transport system permease subunit